MKGFYITKQREVRGYDYTGSVFFYPTYLEILGEGWYRILAKDHFFRGHYTKSITGIFNSKIEVQLELREYDILTNDEKLYLKEKFI